jgi:hypothetical protein
MRRAVAIVVALGVGTSAASCEELRRGLEGSPAPTVAPAVRTVEPDRGRAILSLGGDVRGRVTVVALRPPARYTPPSGPAVLGWRSERFEVLTIEGLVAAGSQRTSATLRVQLLLDLGDRLVALVDEEGRCAIRVGRADDRAIAGTMRCRRLVAEDGTAVRMRGSFEAGVG